MLIPSKQITIVLCFVLCLSCIAYSQVTTKSLGSMSIVATGRVDVARLSDFAPPALTQACDFLVQGSPNRAAPLFQTELEHHPNDLAAFVGFAQSRPDLWAERIAYLKKSGLRDSTSQFKLGLLLFYQWETEVSSGRQDNVTQLKTAKKLLSKAWTNNKNPVIGMALVETTRFPYPDDATATSLLREMVKQLAGSTAYQAYEKAGNSGWQEAPPPVKGIAFANRRPLHGVVSDLWSRAGTQIVYQAASDKKTPIIWKPLPPDKQTEENYLNAWRTVLTQL